MNEAWLEIQRLQQQLEAACLRWMEADMERDIADADVLALITDVADEGMRHPHERSGRGCGAVGRGDPVEPARPNMRRKALLVVPPEGVSGGWSVLEGRIEARRGDAEGWGFFRQERSFGQTYRTLDDALAATRGTLNEMAGGELPDIRTDFGAFLAALIARAERNGQTREAVVARLQDYLDHRAGLQERQLE